MVQGVLCCGDDKTLTNAVELCIICQWEWKICGAGTSIKVGISTWRYWTVWISHPLWGISEGQINAWFFSIHRPSVFCPYCHCVSQSNYQLMNGRLFFQLPLCIVAVFLRWMLTRNCCTEIQHLKFSVKNSQVKNRQDRCMLFCDVLPSQSVHHFYSHPIVFDFHQTHRSWVSVHWWYMLRSGNAVTLLKTTSSWQNNHFLCRWNLKWAHNVTHYLCFFPC